MIIDLALDFERRCFFYGSLRKTDNNVVCRIICRKPGHISADWNNTDVCVIRSYAGLTIRHQRYGGVAQLVRAVES